MMQTCMKALRIIGPHAGVEAIFITGPLMDNQRRERLREQAKGLKVRVLTHVEDSLSYLNAAHLVVTMAGLKHKRRDAGAHREVPQGAREQPPATHAPSVRL